MASSGGPGRPERRRRASLYRPRRRFGSSRRALRITIIVMLLVAVLAAAGAAVAFAGYNVYKGELPNAAAVAAMEPPQDSFVYDASGHVIHVYHGPPGQPTARHLHVSLNHVSRWARLATIDIEDRHFYTEGSWDLPRLVGAAVHDVTHSGSTQGASTITEQLAKLSFAGNSTPRTFDYKIKEIVLGNEIAANFTKDQVLEMYLNRVFYGNNAIGIETAARLYFKVPASKLDLAQAALLAGLPQSPSYYDPLVNETKNGINPLGKARQLQVLNAMVSNGDITRAQATAAYDEHLKVYSWLTSEPRVDLSFVDYVTTYLEQHFGDSFIQPGGWHIYTTLNPRLQVMAEAVVNKQIAANGAHYNMHDASLVSLDPRTGAVIDMVGTWNYNDPYFGSYNMATSRLNPGSTVKLFTYTAAIASGKFTMTTPILDESYRFYAPDCHVYKCGYTVRNYDGRYHGVCELKKCLGESFNMPAVKVEVGTGIPYITNLAYAAGVHSLSPKVTCRNYLGQIVPNVPGPYDFAATLGFYNCTGISLLDLANGAATVADLGTEHDATPVQRIVDSTGAVVFAYRPAQAARQVVPSNAAFIMNQILSNDANRQPEFGYNDKLTISGRRVAAKTGTGEGGTGNGFLDNLTVGWSPELLTAVWVGNPHPWCWSWLPKGEPCGTLNDVASGITGAAPIWQAFMTGALQGTPNDWYATPKDVVQQGTGPDANYFLPTTTSSGHPGGCYYWGPSPEPDNPCMYTGTTPPPWYKGAGAGGNPAAPAPTPSPSATPGPQRHHGHRPKPSPAPTPPTT